MEIARSAEAPAFTGATEADSVPAAPEVRWAGIALALSAFTFVVAILLYAVVYGQPAGTGEGGAVTLQDSATHMVDRWWFISNVWLVEAVGMVVMALAAFALQGRALVGPGWFPARVAWSAVAIGALLQAVMYAFMLGGYPPATADLEGSLVSYDVMRGAANFLFHLGNAALYLGLAGVFFAEAAPVGVLPKWLGVAGAVVAFSVTVVMVGLIADVGHMLFAAPGAMLGYLLAAYVGIAIWRRR